MNYVQILTTTAAFNLDWPSYVKQYLEIIVSVGEASEAFISVDCLVINEGWVNEIFEVFKLKIIVLSIIPILMPLFFLALFTGIRLCFK